MHRDAMDQEFVARLFRVAGNQLESGILGDQFVDKYGDVTGFDLPIQWRAFGALLFRRNVDSHAGELDASNVPRLVDQAGPAHVPGKFPDFDERRNVRATVIVEGEAPPFTEIPWSSET